MKITRYRSPENHAAEDMPDAGDGAHYFFDYSTQEAVVMAPTGCVPLSEWRER